MLTGTLGGGGVNHVASEAHVHGLALADRPNQALSSSTA